MAFLSSNLLCPFPALRRSGPWAQKNCSNDPNHRRLFACPGLRSVLEQRTVQGILAHLSRKKRVVRCFLLCYLLLLRRAATVGDCFCELALSMPSAAYYFLHTSWMADAAWHIKIISDRSCQLPAIRRLILFCSFF